jgi:hypothetical protein
MSRIIAAAIADDDMGATDFAVMLTEPLVHQKESEPKL